MGRFVSPDIFGGYSTNPKSWNRYSYSLNNPLKYKDPDGKLVQVAVGVGAGALISSGIQVYRNYQSGAPLTQGVGQAALRGAVFGGVATVLPGALGGGVAAHILSGAITGGGGAYVEAKQGGASDAEAQRKGVNGAIVGAALGPLNAVVGAAADAAGEPISGVVKAAGKAATASVSSAAGQTLELIDSATGKTATVPAGQQQAQSPPVPQDPCQKSAMNCPGHDPVPQ